MTYCGPPPMPRDAPALDEATLGDLVREMSRLAAATAWAGAIVPGGFLDAAGALPPPVEAARSNGALTARAAHRAALLAIAAAGRDPAAMMTWYGEALRLAHAAGAEAERAEARAKRRTIVARTSRAGTASGIAREKALTPRDATLLTRLRLLLDGRPSLSHKRAAETLCERGEDEGLGDRTLRRMVGTWRKAGELPPRAKTKIAGLER